ncbi:hypothetical protein FACS1894137_11610 [Spirochaetia bacterium]|nr:hypothetical protein FACS1894137_11610 [Spirochaetia bacterium]
MLLIFAIIIFIVSYLLYIYYRTYLAPAVILSFVWGAVLFGYAVLPHGMYSISLKTGVVFLLWILSSIYGACLFSKVKIFSVKRHDIFFNSSVRRVYYLISVVTIFPIMYIAYKQGTSMTAGSFLFNLRMVNSGLVESEYQFGILKYASAFSHISLLMEIYSSEMKKEKHNIRLPVLFIINFITAIISMSKAAFIRLFIPILFIKILKNNIPVKKILLYFVLITIVMISIQILRATGSGGKSEGVVSSMFNVYIFGGIPALDKMVNAETHTAENPITFTFFYKIYSALGGHDNQTKSINDVRGEGGYIRVSSDHETNVYTAIFPYWADWGFVGVIIGGFFAYGVLFGIFFKLVNCQKAWGILVYSDFLTIMAFPFFSEGVISQLSYIIQLVILSWFANNFKYKFKWY